MSQFLDTNVLLYAYDSTAGARHTQASALVLRLARSGEAAISVQVLQEFYVNAVRKIAEPMSPSVARERLRAFSRWKVHTPMSDDVLAASTLSEDHQLSFWDALIVRSASALECSVLWTDDLNPSQVISGVEVRSPFE